LSFKRLKLKKYSAGPAVKQALVTILSGSVSGSITDEIRTDKYIFGWEGNLSTDTSLSANSIIFNEGFFDRQYSINHPDITTFNGYNLKVDPTNSDITDLIQFGNYAFNLTNATTYGTGYATVTQLTSNEAVSGDISGSYYYEPHQVVTYVPDTTASEIQYYITKMNFNITPESPDIVYGLLSGNNFILYVPDVFTSGNIVYSLSGGIPNSLPFNYILEQPLNYQVKFSALDVVWGDISGNTTFVYAISAVSGATGPDHPDIYAVSPENDDTNIIYYNPFKCKNMYNNNWNIEVTRPDILYGCRDYLRIGKTQNQPWLCYKYYRETYNDIQEFELIERVRGLYKLVPFAGHKSNIYSIRITNSGLNESITDENIKSNIKKIVEKAIIKAVRKIAPSYTQLWYIDWTGA